METWEATDRLHPGTPPAVTIRLKKARPHPNPLPLEREKVLTASASGRYFFKAATASFISLRWVSAFMVSVTCMIFPSSPMRKLVRRAMLLPDILTP
jgi:hypothetical protein